LLLFFRDFIMFDGSKSDLRVKSRPIATPFSRPIATPHRALVRAYPRHA
jgi:hypothetical protein